MQGDAGPEPHSRSQRRKLGQPGTLRAQRVRSARGQPVAMPGSDSSRSSDDCAPERQGVLPPLCRRVWAAAVRSGAQYLRNVLGDRSEAFDGDGATGATGEVLGVEAVMQRVNGR
eukprot:Skav231921  [mRNA]  locus=scaffold3399:5640:8019:- [translate_table: standard]